MRQTLKIVNKISALQYLARDTTTGRTYKVDSSVPVRVGHTVRTNNLSVTGVVRSEVVKIYNV